MRNLFTILRRELGTYFNSPIGYIFIVVLLFINSFLYMSSFFAIKNADMRMMFEFLPFILCVFIPLVSMRLWAEDRKENTIEMLLTFPMKPHELVLGKYFASLIFFFLSLVGTLTIPVMIGSLGSPDWGMIIGSYAGAFLLGALFLAVGIFLSGLVNDQIVAAVLSIAACFSLYLSGMDFIAAFFNSVIPEMGTFLKETWAVTNHYQTFTRGIIELSNILYFGTWIVLFLFLNGFALETRNRKGYATNFVMVLVLSLGIGMMANFIFGGFSLKRLDLTEGQIYTVSPSTGKILSDLDAPVNINIYISPKEEMPTVLQPLEQDLVDKLEEMRLVSSGNLRYKSIHMYIRNIRSAFKDYSNEEEKEREKSLEESLIEKGVRPMTVSVFENDRQLDQLVFSSIGIAYKDKPEEFFPVSAQSLQNLEYQIVSSVYRMSRKKKPVIALVAPKNEIDPQMRQQLQMMGQKVPEAEDHYGLMEKALGTEGYDIRRVKLTKDDPLPDEIDAIALINPRKLNARQKWEIARALHNGINVFVAVQNYAYNYSVKPRSIHMQKQEEEPQVNDWLQSYGVKIDDKLLLDSNSVALSFEAPSEVPANHPLAAILPRTQEVRVTMPTHMVVLKDNMNPEATVTNRIEQIPYFWGSALILDETKITENKLKKSIVLNTSPSAWKLAKDYALSTNDREPPAQGLDQYPLMVILEGQFPSVFEGDDRPKWPKADQPQTPTMPALPQPEDDSSALRKADPKPGKLMVLGVANLFTEQLLGNSYTFLVNVVDVLVSSDDLVDIRAKSIPVRRINDPKPNEVLSWKLINYLLVPILLIILGATRGYWRRRQRENYIVNMQKA